MLSKGGKLAVALVLICLTSLTVYAESLRERMARREPEIVTMKADGILGENNIGLLEYRGRELHLAIVKEENEDRLKLYKAMGRKMNKTFTEVGRLRAIQIAGESPAGTWLQDAGGKWYRK